MMVVAFGMGTWIGTHMSNPLLTLAQGLWFWSICLALAAWLGVRKIPLITKPETA
jgi:DHA1 family bicyclomycin/chloramphenicol resistance-like MFS transporter